MKAQILKNMVVDGRLLQSGDIIDVKGWKHAKALNRSRYIRIIEDTKPVKVEAPKVETPVAEAPTAEEKPKAKKEVAPE
jgi:hypothetical protein